MELRQS
jgi:hypothetical protein